MTLLADLPVDLLLVLADYLSGRDLKQLASINSTFRKVLAPSVFHTIKVKNRETCTGALAKVADEYARHVQAIRFLGEADVWEEEQEITRAPADQPLGPQGKNALLPAVTSILAGHVFPRARSISVHFDIFFPWSWTCACDESCVEKPRHAVEFYYEEADVSVSHLERNSWWRSLLSEAFRALAQNRNLRILSLGPLISKMTTAFLSEDFQTMLSRLESLHIATQDMVGGGHAGFLSRLDDVFFWHASFVRDLRLEFPVLVDLLASVRAATALATSSSTLPHLKHFTLRRSFVGRELIRFALSHAETLQTLTLDGCMCSPHNDGENWPRADPSFTKWAHVFATLRRSCVALTTVDVTPRDGFDHPALEGDEYGCARLFENRHGPDSRDNAGGIREPREVAVAREKVREDPKLWAFEYFEFAQLRVGSALVPAGHELGLEEFERGEDQREFDLLQEVLKARRMGR